MSRLGIVGAGRAGTSLGVALAGAGHEVVLHSREPKRLPAVLSGTAGPVPPWLAAVEVVLLAVPDDVIGMVARRLLDTGAVRQRHVVLHISGALGREALDPLAPSGAALGSFHPFQTLADPERAAERLAGAVAGVEGDARAVAAARALAESLGMRAVPVAADRKPLYHAAAVFTSNYVVALAGVAEVLLCAAGFGEAEARQAIVPLMRGSVDSVARMGAKPALTGPVARGDRATVARHLAELPPDARSLYRALARAALALADPAPERRREIETLLDRS